MAIKLVMKVRVTLETGNILSFGQKRKLGDFSLGLKQISIEPLEPNCPFCGKLLSNAHCDCDDYRNAVKKLTSVFVGKKDLKVYAYMVKTHYLSTLTKENATYEPLASAPQNALTLFDFGTTAKPRFFGYNTIYISQGNIDGDVLTFYTREEGDSNIYKWVVRGIEIKNPPYPLVTIAEVISRPLRARDTSPSISYEPVAEYPYSDFLKMLTN